MTPTDDAQESQPGGLTQTVKHGAAFAGAGYVMTQTIGFGTTLVLARTVTPEEFGVFAAGCFLLSFGVMFAESGMMGALIQRQDRVEEAAATAVVSTVLSGLLLAVLAAVTAPLVGRLFHSHDVTLVAAAVSGILLLRASTIVPEALMQKRFEFRRRVVVDPAMTIAYGAVAIPLTAAGFGIWGLVIAMYASYIALVVSAWALVRWRPRLGLASYRMWRELASFGRHLLTAMILARVRDSLETVLVGRYLGTSDLGNYRYATRLAIIPSNIVISVGSYVLLPAFSSIAADPPRLRGAFLRALRWMWVLVVPLSLIMLPLGEPLVVVLFGSIWRDAGLALMAMCFLSIGEALIAISAEGAKAAGHPALLSRLGIVTVIVGPITMLALLPLGLVGFSAAISISATCVGLYAIVGASRILELRARAVVGELLPPLVAGVTMAIAVYALDHFVVKAGDHGTLMGLVLLGAEGIVAGLIYVTVLTLVAPDVGQTILRGLRSAPGRMYRLVPRRA